MLEEKTNRKLKETICENLDELSQRRMDEPTLKNTHLLTDVYKNLLKIEMLEQVGDEYSNDGSYRYGGSYEPHDGRSYDGGSSNRGSYYGTSNARRGEHWVRGHYSLGYDDDMSNAYGRRSYADGKEPMMRELENLMGMASSEQDRKAIQHCMEQIKQA